jgi:DNA-binding transcriptional LysR family regulator
MASPQWDGINEFVSVAECGSFTKAAEQLGISTAQVSRQISAMEKRLSTKLMYRTTRKVTLTEAGSDYYQQCRSILDALEAAQQQVLDQQHTTKGLIKLTAPVTFGEQAIAPIVNDFVMDHPDVTIQMNLTNTMVDLVADGYDLAIRLGELENSSMMAKRLTTRALFVCASPDYLSRNGAPYTLSELDQHNCLQGNHDYWRFIEDGHAKHLKVRGSIKSNSGLALVDAALKGIGLIQLPDYYVRPYLTSGQLIPLLKGYQEARDGVWAVYPNTKHLTLRVRRLIDFIADRLSRS